MSADKYPSLFFAPNGDYSLFIVLLPKNEFLAFAKVTNVLSFTF